MEDQRASPSAVNENAPHVSSTDAAFFFFFSFLALQPGVTFFVIGQLLIARWSVVHSSTAVVAIVLGKAAIFHRRLERAKSDNTKRPLIDFSFSLQKKQKIVAGEEKEVVLVEGDGREGRECFVWRFKVGSAKLKKFQISWLAKRCLVVLLRRPTFFLYSLCSH